MYNPNPFLIYRVFLRPSNYRFEAPFCVRHTEKYAQYYTLKTDVARPSFFQSWDGWAGVPFAPLLNFVRLQLLVLKCAKVCWVAGYCTQMIKQSISPPLPRPPPHPDQTMQMWMTGKKLLLCYTATFVSSNICNRIWENPPYGIFCENRVWCGFDKLYHRANPSASLRPIASFALELERFVCDCATSLENEKLWSKGVGYAHV